MKEQQSENNSKIEKLQIENEELKNKIQEQQSENNSKIEELKSEN